MSKPSFDPGFTQQVGGILRRAINKDGSFNVRRRRTHWRDVHPYLYVISISWPAFLGLVFASYLLVNTLFAGIYYLIGPGALQGHDPEAETSRFLTAFFFSAHTLTTVGYGSLAPRTNAAIPARAAAPGGLFLSIMTNAKAFMRFGLLLDR